MILWVDCGEKQFFQMEKKGIALLYEAKCSPAAVRRNNFVLSMSTTNHDIAGSTSKCPSLDLPNDVEVK